MKNQIVLREFKDSDIKLFKIWLYTPHVEKWYENPLSWIDEIEKRNKEYSWIHHFIVECEGKPIGFCQYYEYCNSEETWHGNTEIDGTYSIDYLIGDTNYIRKGLSKEIISSLISKIKLCDNAKLIIVQPESDNSASCRALLSSKFNFDPENKIYTYRL